MKALDAPGRREQLHKEERVLNAPPYPAYLIGPAIRLIEPGGAAVQDIALSPPGFARHFMTAGPGRRLSL